MFWWVYLAVAVVGLVLLVLAALPLLSRLKQLSHALRALSARQEQVAALQARVEELVGRLDQAARSSSRG